MTQDPDDPKGLIREAYRIERISDAECRSILMDWALSLADGQDQRAALQRVLLRYGADPAHPMSLLLRDGLQRIAPMGRRGGSRGRTRHQA